MTQHETLLREIRTVQRQLFIVTALCGLTLGCVFWPDGIAPPVATPASIETGKQFAACMARMNQGREEYCRMAL